MYGNGFLIASLAIFGLLFPALGADDPNPGTPAADAPKETKLPSWLELGGQIRGRFEDPSGSNVSNENSDGYYLSRIRVDLGIRPSSWLRFFVEAQDARVGGYNTSPAPNTVSNPIELRQGYVELNRPGGLALTVKAGRQTLIFGGERLVGASDWGISRTFDAVDLTLSAGRAKVDLFAGSVVLIDPTRFDRHKPGEHLYGAYGSVQKVLPGMNIEPYLLWKQTLLVAGEKGGIGDALIVTPGVRIFGKTLRRLDYTAELAVQRGSYSADSVSAMAGSYVAGWTLNGSAFKPRISVEFNHASGDPASKDGTRQTFDQLYPTNHSYYGIADQMGWKNMRNPRVGFDFEPIKKWKLRADFNEFYLATTQDGLYNASGTRIVLNRAATSRHVGSEADFIALYKFSKMWTFGGGYGHLFPGEYLKQSKASFGYSFPYLMFIGNF